MRGQVSDDGREARLTLTVASPDPTGRMVEVAAALDTGFTADLALPADVIGTLQLPELGTVDVALADGHTTSLRVHAARVQWQGRDRHTVAYGVDGAALVGMGLLRGFVLEVDVVPNGAVTIRSRPGGEEASAQHQPSS